MLASLTGSVELLIAVLDRLQGLLVVVSILAMMASLGLGLTRGDVLATIREYDLVSRWIIANLLAVPLFAVLFGVLFGLPDPFLLALVLVAVAPGAPFIPRLVALAGEDSHEATRLTAALSVVAAIVVPLLVDGVILALGIETGFSPWRILLVLVWLFVAPLVAGGAVRTFRPWLAVRLVGPLDAVASATLAAALVAVVLANPGGTIRVFTRLFGTGALFVLALFVLVTIAVGWLAGGPTPRSRRINALGTAGRNVNISLLIAVSAFPESPVDDSIVAFAVLMLTVSLLVAVHWRRRPLAGESAGDGEESAGDGEPLAGEA